MSQVGIVIAGGTVTAFSPDQRQFVHNADGGLYLRSMGDLKGVRLGPLIRWLPTSEPN